MATALPIFVSHSHEDSAFCHALVQALRDAGADVWYDEHDMGSGRLGPTIEQELRKRPVFVVILSPAALHSPRVEDETRWAYGLWRKDARRILLPVTVATLQEADIWRFLRRFRRVEPSGLQPFPPKEAVLRTLRTLALIPIAPHSTNKRMDDPLTRGKALAAQQQYVQALLLFKRATQLAPGSFDAWANLASVLIERGQWDDALAACDHALALNDQQAWLWSYKGIAVGDWGRWHEALAAYDRALTLDDQQAWVWANKGTTLARMGRAEEALAARERALEIDPSLASVWSATGGAFGLMGRDEEAIAAFEQALTLDPNDQELWHTKAVHLRTLGRVAEAEAAERRAKELGG
jgi:Flp pilus assembly protein TadD